MPTKFLITMQFDEDFLLPIFLKHYCQFFKPEDVYIIDHGSAINLVPGGFNRIFVPRDRPFSEKSRLTLIKNLAAGLLKFYDMGIYVDVDELISLKNVDLNNINAPVTYVAGFEVFWNAHSKLIGILNPYECKPLIFRELPSWGLGFHNSEIETNMLSIPMAHIRYLYKNEAKKRLQQRIAVYAHLDKAEFEQGIARHWSEGDQEMNKFYSHVEGFNNVDMNYQPLGQIDPLRVFNMVAQRSLYISTSQRYSAKGDWSLFKNNFFDLSDYFPTLVNPKI